MGCESRSFMRLTKIFLYRDVYNNSRNRIRACIYIYENIHISYNRLSDIYLFGVIVR